MLLTDITANFRKPCVMDLKMGTQTYEPDASDEKKTREMNKYPQQEHFGFRIIGMRFYDPSHPSADANGYRFFPKEYGRSLATTADVLDALRLFLSAGCVKQEEEPEAEEEQPEKDLQQQPSNGDDESLSKDSLVQQQDEKPESVYSLDQSIGENNNSSHLHKQHGEKVFA